MSEQPFNSLGQIIAQGGEIALGLAISHGWTNAQIASLFARRFEPMTASDRDRLVEIAKAASDAAADLTDRIPDGPINADDIPTIPGMFGEDTEGNRVKIIGEVQFAGSDKWYQTRVNFPDIPSMPEALSEIADKGKDINKSLRNRGEVGEETPDTITGIRISFLGKAF